MLVYRLAYNGRCRAQVSWLFFKAVRAGLAVKRPIDSPRLELGAFGARPLMYHLAVPILSGVSSSRSAALRSTKQLSTLY